ncbi:RrF2 family transcriptional regulator [Maribacter sp. 2210JD10-5]|uniref:RrF2 family transcriptional regulator n=1 Tax=Maribacter sp. 2210JD10-5 TaxID=3386272 RepID=UPI0039BCC6AD
MISNSSKYALIGVLYLAVNSTEEKKILAKDLSKNTGVPQAYLSKLLQELVRHKLISSTRGPKGGFYLTEENREVRLIDIINVIDGEHRLNTCILSPHKCNEEHPCPLHNLMGNTKKEFSKKLEETKVKDLVSDIEQGKSFLAI